MNEKKETFDYRVRFSKHGALKYIGHLDVMRYFQKVLRRSEVDVAYTNGFSPHEITTFAQPLGVGIESDREYMDVKMNTFISCDELKNRINTHSVPEIQAVSVKRLPPDSGNAMASVAAAEYYVGFKKDIIPDFISEDSINEFMSLESIILQKEGKAGIREIDIKDRIYDFKWDKNEKCFHMTVDASSGYNIKPSSLLELYYKYLNKDFKADILQIYRADTYTRDESGDLLSMGDVGIEC